MNTDLRGQHLRGKIGPKANRWNGGKYIKTDGYVMVIVREDDRRKYPYIREHVMIAEKVLGKHLPEKAVVHHVNGNTLDNRNENLVICENRPYHQLLHRRKKAYDACGHANWKQCWICDQYDDPINLVKRIKKDHDTYAHQMCERKYSNERYAKKLTRK